MVLQFILEIASALQRCNRPWRKKWSICCNSLFAGRLLCADQFEASTYPSDNRERPLCRPGRWGIWTYPGWSGEFEPELLSLCSEIRVFIFDREVFILAHNTQNCLLFIFSTEAVKQIIDYLGMQPCERYDKVDTEKNSRPGVTMNITVRSDDPVVSEVVLSAVG